ncbi:hypothetical protein [Streptomyces griseosporeus]|uniref:hypothetical protein n=1 Tax=Streptomyces griseosporeus TaxID=1910 RepID=UPI0037033F67
MKPGPGPWWSWRYSRIRCQWPTSLPGIRFNASGTLAYRAAAPIKASGAAAVRAAARLALDAAGRGITMAHLPEQLDTAQGNLTLAVAQWHAVHDRPGLWLRARITLRLSEPDAARAQTFQDAVRQVTLELRQEQERRERFTATVLTKPDAARTWWLERHLDDLNGLDWDAFREKVLPLVGAADDTHTNAERIARLLLYVWEKLGADPGQHARFTATVRTVFEQMGWADAVPWLPAEESAAAAQPAESGAKEDKRDQAAETGVGL